MRRGQLTGHGPNQPTKATSLIHRSSARSSVTHVGGRPEPYTHKQRYIRYLGTVSRFLPRLPTYLPTTSRGQSGHHRGAGPMFRHWTAARRNTQRPLRSVSAGLQPKTGRGCRTTCGEGVTYIHTCTVAHLGRARYHMIDPPSPTQPTCQPTAAQPTSQYPT